MSTIKSSNEHLTLNADGASKDIKFQANGVEKASISSAGAFTSTTIDATVLTGALPAISGAALTGVGVAGITSSADATAITIDSSENVGIGNTSPEKNLDVAESARVKNTGSSAAEFDITSGSTWRFRSNPTSGTSPYGLDIVKGSAGTDVKMSIDSSGNWVRGTASAGNSFFKVTNNATQSHCNTGSTVTTDQGHFYFTNPNGNVGSIRTLNSGTSYNTSSDYRLKENVDYTWDATTRLKQLKPARFNFIADDTNTLVDGFIAHEVSSVVPEAISGTKDAMIAEVLYVEGDELPEGKVVGDVKTAATIDPQGIDQSKLVPLLVKTIQELEARITALEA